MWRTGERKSLARPSPILLEFNHFDDRIGGRFVSPRVEPPKRRLVRGATRRSAIPLLSTIRSTLPHQLPPRRNGGASGRLSSIGRRHATLRSLFHRSSGPERAGAGDDRALPRDGDLEERQDPPARGLG